MARALPILLIVDLILVVAALISCLSAEDEDIRALPRVVWVLIILLFSPVGPIAWFVAGRERTVRARRTWRQGSGFPEHERPGRTVAPDDNPEFLRGIEINRREQEAAKRQEEEREMLREWEDDLRRREEELRKPEKPEETS